MAAFAAILTALSAFAIDPHRLVSQYLHDSWGTDKGFPSGSVSAIAQTNDGYLWIGTDKGLIRFDGLNFRRFEQANPGSFSIGPVRTLLADDHNNLWVLLENTKLFRYHDGGFELSRGAAENGVTAMGLGPDGKVVLSSLAMGVLTFDGKQFLAGLPNPMWADPKNAAGEIPDERTARLNWSTGVVPHRVIAPTSAVISMASTSDGRVWLGTQDRGLSYLRDGHVYGAAKGSTDMKVNCFLPLNNSELWVGTNKGVLHWNGTELTRKGLPSSLLDVEVLSMIRDRDSNIWIGTTRGLLRVNVNGVSTLSHELRGGSQAVSALFEDREGNIWMGSTRGLERLRDSAFATYTVPGLKSQATGPVYIGSDDRVWFAPIGGGLRWLTKGQSAAVTAAGLMNDTVYSITGKGENDLWVGRQRGGLTHLHYVDGVVAAKTYTQADGLAENSVYAVHESRDGTIWSGTLGGGVTALQNGHFTTYTTTNGLASNIVSSMLESRDGTMWFGTPNGLSALSKGTWRTYTVRDGLASQDVNCLLEDSSGVLWIGTAGGIAFFSAGQLKVPMSFPDSLHEAILGLVEDRQGELWVATANHVLQVKRANLMDDALEPADIREYGVADGLLSTENIKRYQSVVVDSQGYVWLSTSRGLSVVNPARGTVNSVPALVHIEGVSVDGTPYDTGGRIRVPAGKQRTTFRYVGLSLGNSERVRYRYMLEGFDHGWSEAVTNREATYGNLGAGTYRFHVMASNSDGQWNGTEAAVGFEVEPKLWQTFWFRLVLIGCMGLLVLAVYRLRMSQMTRVLNARFEERLAERTRIAQDLHDTLLQEVLSASMQLHVLVDGMAEDSPARPGFDHILQMMRQIIDEGRNTLRGLRSSIDAANDLQNSFARIPQELGEPAVGFRVVVEGEAVALRSAIRDDVYRIGREALVNAFRHSGASQIDLYLEYVGNLLRILVRDDGCGIAPQVLQSGRDGHFGLSGMRERAERIGAKLRVFSRPGVGTEVELRVPSNVAFESPTASLASKWFRRWPLRSAETGRIPKQKVG